MNTLLTYFLCKMSIVIIKYLIYNFKYVKIIILINFFIDVTVTPLDFNFQDIYKKKFLLNLFVKLIVDIYLTDKLLLTISYFDI